MSKIIIVGLGPAEAGLLTVNALGILKKAEFLILRTSRHPITSFLKKEKIPFESFDHVYEECEDFEEVYRRICESLIDLAQKYEEVTYAVPGHPLVGEKVTLELLERLKETKVNIEIRPGLTFLDSLYATLALDPLRGVQIIDALEISNQLVSPSLDLIVTQVFSRLIASDVKIHLLHYYPSDWPVTIVRGAGSAKDASVISLPLAQLDHYKMFDHLTSLYLPSCAVPIKASFDNLLEIMARLRSPSGCPWDREQTHSSLKRHLVEESYEVIEAIDSGESKHLREELGDLLLQVVFHAQIASEGGEFTIYDVLESIVEKLAGRHPHIFGQEEAQTPEDVVVHWEEAKRREGKTKLLSEVPQSLPALLGAYKLQKKAARVGFDWVESRDVLKKLAEEVEEFMQVCTQEKDIKHLEDEIGDMLFTIANVARHFGIEPEGALRKTLKKFRRRFEYIEKEAGRKNIQLADMSLEEKDMLWQEAKELENER